MLDPENARVARARMTQIFRYLQDLNQLRNPAKRLIREQPWLLWLRQLPQHPSVQLLTPADANRQESGETVSAFSLQVTRPSLTDAPVPPPELERWIVPGWDDPDGSPKVREQLDQVDESGQAASVSFGDDPARLELFAEWRSTWEAWSESERPAQAAYRLFERLYALRSQLEREAERLDLVLGDGLLLWQRPGGDIEHPLLSVRLQLEFLPDTATFILSEAGSGVELYTALLRAEPEVDGRELGEAREELDREGYHPLGGADTTQFLSRLALRLSPHGQLLPPGEAPVPGPQPRIARAPAVFLRSRTLGFAPALEAALEDLRTTADLPPSLVGIVGIQPPPESPTSSPAPGSPLFDEGEDVLLCKPSNAEQIQIVRRLAQHGSVLVQGPPGTGKTHTIGNLIGHLLAQGKRILVTSHTPKALRVLQQQVVSSLQPLCVSVLESDAEGQQHLHSSIDGIVERLSRDDAEQLEKEADRLQTERRKLLSQLQAARQRLAEARNDEYRDVVVGGVGYAPADAAREVARGRGTHDWIPGPVTAGAALPLSQVELAELYGTQHTVQPNDVAELEADLPAPNDLLTPDEFTRVVHELRALDLADKDTHRRFWSKAPRASTFRCGQCGTRSPRDRAHRMDTAAQACDACHAALPVWTGNAPAEVTPALLLQLSEELTQAVSFLADLEPWKKALVSDGCRAGNYRGVWLQLLQLIEEVAEEAAEAWELLLRFRPTLPQGSHAEQARLLSDLVRHVEGGGKLGWLTWLQHGDWKQLTQQGRVGDAPPTELDHYRSLLAAAHLQSSRAELQARWTQLVVSAGGPACDQLGPELERTCAQFAATLRRSLNWYLETWAPLEDQLGWYGFHWDAFLEETPPVPDQNGEVTRIHAAVTQHFPPVIAAWVNQLRWTAAENTLRGLEEKLAPYGQAAAPPTVVLALREAVAARNTAEYTRAFHRLQNLVQVAAAWKRRKQLLARLAPAAPGWAQVIDGRIPPHAAPQLPGDPEAAWRWRQFHQELRHRQETRLEVLQGHIENFSTELRKTTSQLVDRRAWAARLRGTEPAHRQSLLGWQQLVKRIGKATGKRAPRLMAEARRQMDACRSAVSVWIMPLNRVVENFRPQAGLFDVVIIDEASQSDVMALLALYMGKQVVIVGDDEQVSPDAVGQRQDEVQQLIDAHLGGIPNRELYDGQVSIYDLARTSFGGHICLREHFRCVADIIQFSNHLSYYGKILPLRDESRVVLQPHTVAYRVAGHADRRGVNEQEAQSVVALIAAAAEQPEYQGKTFGVICLVGEAQALRCDQLLRARLGPALYERLKGGPGKAFCGNPPQFQGDERDVMVLSLVDSPRDGPLALRGFGPRDSFKKRYNVAASRARDQMWLVHSLNPEIDLKPGDLRRRLLEHFLTPGSLRAALKDGERRVESEFERQVLQRLVARGYSVVPQWNVGHYRLDLVVQGAHQRLAVECDGDRYHTEDNLHADLERQALLERLGWTFSRIRGSAFFQDPETALQPVWEKLEQLGIQPSGSEVPEPQETSELCERVIRLAEAWMRSEPAEPREGELHEGELQEDPLEEGGAEPILTPCPAPLPVVGNGIIPCDAAADADPVTFSTGTHRGAHTLLDGSPTGITAQVASTSTVSTAGTIPASEPPDPVVPPTSQVVHFDRNAQPAATQLAAMVDALSRHLGDSDRRCLKCQALREIRVGRFGPYLRCSVPNCGKNDSVAPEVLRVAISELALTCSACNRPMKVSRSRHGYFLGCTGYPECKTALPWSAFSALKEAD